MRDAPLEQRAVVETLVAFLRERRGEGLQTSEMSDPTPPPADAAAALRVIGRRDTRRDPTGADHFGWNLTELDLRDFSLRSGNYAGVNVWRSDLQRANLMGADLREMKGWREANLRGAVYDRRTQLPDGLKPDTSGMRLATNGGGTPGEPRT